MKEILTIALKFIVFVLLIPLVVAVTKGFLRQLSSIPEVLTSFFTLGMFIYLFVHIFIFELKRVYRYGQKLVSDIFRFFDPLVEVAPFFLPIYSILILITFYFATLIFKSGEYGRYFMFLLGFTLAMHFAFTARDLRDKEKNAAKPNYFFAITFIYIVNLFLIALLLDLILSGFSFVEFFTSVTENTKEIYSLVFKQLFLS